MEHLTINWGSILTAVLLASLPTIAASLAAFVIGWIKVKLAEAKALSPSLMDFIELAAEFAVKAAEQAKLGQLIENKKEYAMSVAQAWLTAHGLKDLDLSLVSAAIEKAVLELFPPDETKQMGFEK